MAVTHILLLAEKYDIYNKKLIEMAIGRYAGDLERVRLKDMGILVRTIIQFDYASEGVDVLFREMIHDLYHRDNEAYRFPQSFILCMSHMAMRNVYDWKLLDKAQEAAQPDLAIQPHSLTYNSVQILFLDTILRLNLKNVYKRPFITDKQRIELVARNCRDFVEKSNGLQEVADELYYHQKSARSLPHFQDKGNGNIFDIWGAN